MSDEFTTNENGYEFTMPKSQVNMQAICDKYAPSVKAYLLIPLIGSLFADFINSLVITFFINFL